MSSSSPSNDLAATPSSTMQVVMKSINEVIFFSITLIVVGAFFHTVGSLAKQQVTAVPEILGVLILVNSALLRSESGVDRWCSESIQQFLTKHRNKIRLGARGLNIIFSLLGIVLGFMNCMPGIDVVVILESAIMVVISFPLCYYSYRDLKVEKQQIDEDELTYRSDPYAYRIQSTNQDVENNGNNGRGLLI